MEWLSLKNISSARLAIYAACGLAVVIAILFLLMPAAKPKSETYDIRVTVLPGANEIEVLYRAFTPVERLDIPFPSEQFSALSLAEDDREKGIAIGKSEAGIGILGDEPFGLVSVLVDFTIERTAQGEPIAWFGENSSAINTKWFNPVRVNDQPVSIKSGAGDQFQWVGDGETFDNERVRIIYDPKTPAPVVTLLAPAADQLAGHFSEGFDRELASRPQLMFLYSAGFDGQLAVTGDAIPGVAVIQYTGGGFQNDTEEMQSVVLSNLAHEMVHLWQLEEPRVNTTPDWLHEGLADALAAEALYVSGVWNEDEYYQSLLAAKVACAEALGTGTVRGASGRGHNEANYSCGHMMATALATQQEGMTVMDMWHAFTSEAGEGADALGEEAFLAFARHWSDSPQFAGSLRNFLTNNYRSADGEDVVEKMFNGTL